MLDVTRGLGYSRRPFHLAVGIDKKGIFRWCPLLNKKEGLPIVVWIRAGHDGTGSTRQIKSIISGLKWRLVQDILVCKGSWNKSFVDDCTDLCIGFSIGLETNIY